jgi:hypothetical protein
MGKEWINYIRSVRKTNESWKEAMKRASKLRRDDKSQPKKVKSEDAGKRKIKKMVVGKKGAKSKTHPGDKDFTSKKGDRVHHIAKHDVKEKVAPYQHAT